MNRRNFLKITGLSLTTALIGYDSNPNPSLDIEKLTIPTIDDNMSIGNMFNLQDVKLEPGKKYIISADITTTSDEIGLSIINKNGMVIKTERIKSGRISATFEANDIDNTICIDVNNNVVTDGYVDNVSLIKLDEPQRAIDTEVIHFNNDDVFDDFLIENPTFKNYSGWT